MKAQKFGNCQKGIVTSSLALSVCSAVVSLKRKEALCVGICFCAWVTGLRMCMYVWAHARAGIHIHKLAPYSFYDGHKSVSCRKEVLLLGLLLENRSSHFTVCQILLLIPGTQPSIVSQNRVLELTFVAPYWSTYCLLLLPSDNFSFPFLCPWICLCCMSLLWARLLLCSGFISVTLGRSTLFAKIV